MNRLAVNALLVAAAIGFAGAASARSSDRNQPLELDANSSDC